MTVVGLIASQQVAFAGDRKSNMTGSGGAFLRVECKTFCDLNHSVVLVRFW
ncbi:MAG: hypothetical protein PUP91_10845 [Rhizonema sp. PD37]|nr:hypothetical protein [Rhizonema sp. PD37]